MERNTVQIIYQQGTCIADQGSRWGYTEQEYAEEFGAQLDLDFGHNNWVITSQILAPDELDAFMVVQGQLVAADEHTIRARQELRTAQLATQVRAQRNKLLSQSDFMTTPDYFGSLSADQQNKIVEYRASLRNVPLQPQFPHEVVFPELPVV